MSGERGRRVALVLLGLAVLGYGYRAFWGWYGGLAYIEGKHHVENGRYEEALPYLERGALGADKATALWLRAMAHVGVWQKGVTERIPHEENDPKLVRGHQDYMEAFSLSPSSGWYFVDLAELYHLWDGLLRLETGNLLSLLGSGPWGYVGRQGRIAVGLARMGIEREPTMYAFHDRLALMLLNYELEDLAADVVRESARVQPMYYLHDYGDPRYLKPQLFDAFCEGAREVLGKSPLIPPGKHLIALGQVEVRRENWVQAEEDLRAALELPGHDLQRADTYYHLGLALAGQDRTDEAWDAFERSKEHENFVESALWEQARLALDDDRGDEALAILRDLRRRAPRELRYALRFADVATDLGDTDAALESLRWARTVAPPGPERELEIAARAVRAHLAAGDRRAAEREFRTLLQITGKTERELGWMMMQGEAADLGGL